MVAGCCATLAIRYRYDKESPRGARLAAPGNSPTGSATRYSGDINCRSRRRKFWPPSTPIFGVHRVPAFFQVSCLASRSMTASARSGPRANSWSNRSRARSVGSGIGVARKSRATEKPYQLLDGHSRSPQGAEVSESSNNSGGSSTASIAAKEIARFESTPTSDPITTADHNEYFGATRPGVALRELFHLTGGETDRTRIEAALAVQRTDPRQVVMTRRNDQTAAH